MNFTSSQPWIEAGYEIFALQGPDSLKIEPLARKTGISKSSFYHHFADMEIFHEKLLEYHLQRAVVVAAQARLCKSVEPDLLQLLASIKEDLLFNRQLRIHQNNLVFQLCFKRAHSLVQDEFIGIWAVMLGMQHQPRIAQNILDVTTDLFYQRISPDNLTYQWMVDFICEIKLFLTNVVKSSGVASHIY